MMHSRHSLMLSDQAAANGDGFRGRRLSSLSQAAFVRVTCSQVKRAASWVAVGETAGIFIRIKITLDGKAAKKEQRERVKLTPIPTEIPHGIPPSRDTVVSLINRLSPL